MSAQVQNRVYSDVDFWFINKLSGFMHQAESEQPRIDRTGVGTYDVFGFQKVFKNVEQQFPILSAKKTHWKSIVHELLWFLRGEDNIASLKEAGVSIWDEWADESGYLGPVYGKQWRAWTGKEGQIDQIRWLLNEIKTNPSSRRLLVSAWNCADLPKMALAPCHVMFQCFVNFKPDAINTLDLHVYQRSADLFLGVPFNIASYALLLKILARMSGLRAGNLIYSGGSLHLYANHLEQAKLAYKQFDEEISKSTGKDRNDMLNRPTVELLIDRVTDPADIKFEMINLLNYDPLPAIKAPVAI